VMTVRVCGKEKSGTWTQESRAMMWCLNAMFEGVVD
jgi:hypothetical protein